MFFEGDRNSVVVAVCGERAPMLCAALVVVVVAEVLGVAFDAEVEVDVADAGEDFGVDGLLEHAANATAPVTTNTTPTRNRRDVRGIRRCYSRSGPRRVSH